MPPKKKYRNALRGSTKMARLQGAAKPPASVRSLKNSSALAGASCAAAAITTEVVEMGDSPAKTNPVEVANPRFTLDSPSNISIPVSMESERDTSPLLDRVVCATEGPFVGATRDVVDGSPSETSISTPPAVKNYASLLKASAQLEELGTPTEHISGVPFVLIPDENIVAAKEEFRDFIYARFHGDQPKMGRIIGVVNAIWARVGPRIFVHSIGDGAYLLKVSNAITRESMLARTCWNIAGYPMFVAPWSPEFTPEEAPITTAVIPVELRNVPYLLFNKESLSRIATAVGKPVSLAPETERKENFQVAKLYVNVDLTKALPRTIISGFSNGQENEISVSYPWLPLKCDGCGKYGHQKDKCRQPQTHAKSRQRSASPPATGTKNRTKSRMGRTRHPQRDETSKTDKERREDAKEDGNPSELEEGEVPQSTIVDNAPPGVRSPITDIATSGVHDDNKLLAAGDSGKSKIESKKVSIGSKAADDPPQRDEHQHQPLHLGDKATDGNAIAVEDEAPFFLVGGRKSGRKVTYPH
ncbi:hypothetical protein Rs2_40472 [Raphanus sativus]|nr:hypothetical protein Rs2_40472 [Raphanus sativus]